MTNRPIALACAVAASLLGGCASRAYYGAAMRYQGGDPHAAIEYLALCLREDPEHEDARALMESTIKRIADEHAAKVATLEGAGKYADAVSQCDRVAVTRDVVTKVGRFTFFYDPDQRRHLAKRAAAAFYEEGSALEGKPAFKDAAVRYRLCLAFERTYEDARERYQRCKDQATIRLHVVPFEGDPSLAGVVGMKLSTEVKAKKPEFLDLVAADAEPHQRLSGRVLTTYQDSGWLAQQMSNSGSFQDPLRNPDGTLVKDAKGNTVMGPPYTVSATWTVYTRTTAASVDVSFDVRTADGARSVYGDASADAAEDSARYRSAFETNSAEGFKRHGRAVVGDYMDLTTERRDPRAPQQLAADLLPARISQLAASVYNFYK